MILLVFWTAQLSAATSVSKPFDGVTHIVRTENAPRPVSMHIVKIRLKARGLRFEQTAPGGTRETVRQTTLDFLKQEQAQLAINCHFFVPFPSLDRDAFLVGLAASNGVVFSAFETPQQSYAIVADAPALNIDASNRASIVHRNPNDSSGRSVRERVRLFNAVSGSAQIITNGAKTVPVYRGPASPRGLLTPGGPGQYSNSKSWYEEPNARTVVELSRNDRTLFLFIVDRAGPSRGMTVSEVADLLIKDYGVFNALNLDGGGSTTLAMQDPRTREYALVNRPSGATARAVASSLAIFASDATTFWQRWKSRFGLLW